MNKIILLGNMTRDPEIRYTQGDNPLAIARFGLAVNRRFSKNGEKEADFFNCTAFGKQAEFVEKYFKQGSRMMLAGRIQNDNYTNKNGEKVYAVQVIVEEVEFAEKKNGSGIPAGENAGAVPDADGFMNIPDGIENGLPFN